MYFREILAVGMALIVVKRKLIKASMNDDSSYKHVSTVYHLILNKDPHAIVKQRFAANTYGGVSPNRTVAARVNVRTGRIDSILNLIKQYSDKRRRVLKLVFSAGGLS